MIDLQPVRSFSDLAGLEFDLAGLEFDLAGLEFDLAGLEFANKYIIPLDY